MNIISQYQYLFSLSVEKRRRKRRKGGGEKRGKKKGKKKKDSINTVSTMIMFIIIRGVAGGRAPRTFWDKNVSQGSIFLADPGLYSQFVPNFFFQKYTVVYNKYSIY